MQKHTSFLLIWRSTNYQSGTSYINNSGVHTQHLFWLSRSALLKREEEEEEGGKKQKKTPHKTTFNHQKITFENPEEGEGCLCCREIWSKIPT